MDRVQKVEIVVLGRGLAAVALAAQLAAQGRAVALLAEALPLAGGVWPASLADHEGDAGALAEAGAAQLMAWQGEGVPGIAGADGVWQVDYDALLPALAARVEAGPRCAVATEGRVRGLSVIEGAFLGAIAEEARYDAKRLVNAAEDDRYTAFSRMLRQPHALEFFPFAPTASENAAHATPQPPRRTAPAPVAEEMTVRRAWRMHGVTGWPLLAVGLARNLAERLGV